MPPWRIGTVRTGRYGAMQIRNDIELAFERSVNESLRNQYAQVLSERLPDELLQLLDRADRRTTEPAAI